MGRTAALIVAAGRGVRAGRGGGGPKQYQTIGGSSVLGMAMGAFEMHPAVDLLQVVIHADDTELYRSAADRGGPKVLPPVTGGVTRQASVLAGLAALEAHTPDKVLIHDAARPFLTQDLVSRVIEACGDRGGAIAALPISDTLKRAGEGAVIAGTVARAGLWAAQTPQGFGFQAILAAHRAAATAGRGDFTDDAAIAEWAGLTVRLVEGTTDNMKITTADDLQRADALLGSRREMATRTGLGFDVHALVAGDHVWLGGVRIPHTHGLDGHSDADVALHALTDALLGTIGDGDIGQHFPPSDPQWKGARSIRFLEDAVRRVHQRGGRILNVDITILAEAPRVGPHREAMQAVISAALMCAPRDVGIKATTTETLGFVGRREGIAAMAVASVVLPAGRA